MTGTSTGIQMIRKLSAAVVCAGLAFAAMAATAAQPSYPAKPVRWVVPYSAGGPTDMLVRLVSNQVDQSWSQRIVMDLRPGANSILGTDIVAKAEPNGYTMLVALPALAINPAVYPKLPYDTARDLTPVTLIGSAGYVVVVNASLPVKSVQDFISLAKSKPGQLSFGSGGIASPAHLAMELFQQRAGISMVHVSYKGGAPALVDLAGGRIQIMANPVGSSVPFIKSGKLRAIGMTSSKRSLVLPDVPTIAESGIPSYHVNTWYGLFTPAGTPPQVVAFVAKGVASALQDATLRKRLADLDIEPGGNSPKEFAQFVKDETRQWGEVVRRANIKLEN